MVSGLIGILVGLGALWIAVVVAIAWLMWRAL